jgi:hypothetical protein
VYATIRDNGGWDNWTMVEVEKFPCKDANEATAKEREWFEKLDSSLSTQYPKRSVVEYLIGNRLQRIVIFQTYRCKNKEKIRQYKTDNKDEIALRRKQ